MYSFDFGDVNAIMVLNIMQFVLVTSSRDGTNANIRLTKSPKLASKKQIEALSYNKQMFFIFV